MKVTQSAGGVVLNSKGLVLVVSQKGDSWSLPKGHIDPGEDAYAAAVREIREESGLTDLKLLRPLGTYERFKIAKGGQGEDPAEKKEITLFLFLSATDHLAPEDTDNPEARWVTPEAAAHLLTHPKDREFFASILPLLGAGT